MIRYLLDTDIASMWLQGHPLVTAAVLRVPPDSVGLPIIAFEEIWDGWQAVIRAATTPDRIAHGYDRLTKSVSDLRPLSVVTYAEAAVRRHRELKALKLNVGSNDLRIAAIAVELGAAVVTNNERDYRRVPGLTVENWSLG